MPKSREQVMNRYQRGMTGAGTAYREGVQNTDNSWAGNYIEAAPRMVEGIQRAVAENRPQNAVRALGDSGWREKTLAKADRFTASTTIAVANYGGVVDKVIAAGEAARRAAREIDGTTLEGRIAKVEAAVRATMRHWGKL